MVQRVGGIEIGASANVSQFAGDMGRMQNVFSRSLDRMRRDADATGMSISRLNKAADFRFNSLGFVAASRALGDVNKRADLLRTSLLSLTSVIGGFSLALITNAVAEHADAYKELQNRIRVVTDSEEELAAIESMLFEIAQRSRAGLKETAVLYGRLAIASQNFGTSQADLLRITETLQKAFQVGGANVVESMNAAIQLSQGIASNRLGGDELRSVLENVALARTLADQIAGGDVGKLREMSRAGQLTAKVLLEAFLKASDGIDAAFAEIQPTIRQSFIVLDNAFTKFIGEQDQASGASAIFSNALVGLANNIDTVANAIVLLSGVLVTRYLTKGIDPAIAKGRMFVSALQETRSAIVAEASAVSAAAAERVAVNNREIAAIQAKIAALGQERTAYQQNIVMAQAQLAAAKQVIAAKQASSAAGFGSVATSTTVYQKAITDALNAEKQLIANRALLQQSNAGLIAAQTGLNVATLSGVEASAAASAATKAYGNALATTSTRATLAGAAMTGLTRVMGFFGGPVGFALTAVSAGLLLWALQTDEATEALQAHETAIGKVKIAYDKAGGSAAAFAKAAGETARFESKQQFDALQAQLQDAAQGFANFISATRADMQAGFADPLAPLADSLAKFQEAFRGGDLDGGALQKLSDDIAAVALTNPEFAQLVDQILAMVKPMVELAKATDEAAANWRLHNGVATEADKILLGLADGAEKVTQAFGGISFNSISEGLKALRELSKEGKSAAEVQEKLAEATNTYLATVARIQQSNLPDSLEGQRIAEAAQAYAQVTREIDGTADAQKKANEAMDDFADAAALAGLTEHEQKILKLRQAYDEVIQKLDAASAGTEEYAQAQAHLNAQIEALGGDLSTYDEILNALKQMSPAFREQVADLEELGKATAFLERAEQDLSIQLQTGKITAGEYGEKLANLRNVYDTVKDSTDGFSRAQLRANELLNDFVADAAVLAMTEEQQAVFDLTRDFEELVARLRDVGATQAQLDVATAAYRTQLAGLTGEIGAVTKSYTLLDGSTVNVISHGSAVGPQLAQGLSPLADAIISASGNYDFLTGRIIAAKGAQDGLTQGVPPLKSAYEQLLETFGLVSNEHTSMIADMLGGLEGVFAFIGNLIGAYESLAGAAAGQGKPSFGVMGFHSNEERPSSQITSGQGGNIYFTDEERRYAEEWSRLANEQNEISKKQFEESQLQSGLLNTHGGYQSAIADATQETASGVDDLADVMNGVRIALLDFGTSVSEALSFIEARLAEQIDFGGTEGRQGKLGTIYDQGSRFKRPKHGVGINYENRKELVKLKRDLEWYISQGATEEQLRSLRARIAELEAGNAGTGAGWHLGMGGSFEIKGSNVTDTQPISFNAKSGEEVMVFNDQQQRLLDSMMGLADRLKDDDRPQGNTTVNNAFDLAVHIDPLEDTASLRQRARELAEMVQAEMARS